MDEVSETSRLEFLGYLLLQNGALAPASSLFLAAAVSTTHLKPTVARRAFSGMRMRLKQSISLAGPEKVPPLTTV